MSETEISSLLQFSQVDGAYQINCIAVYNNKMKLSISNNIRADSLLELQLQSSVSFGLTFSGWVIQNIHKL